MDNKDSAAPFSVWLPGTAVILSLVISTFALTRDPFLDARPSGAQFQPQLAIDARLWQDPFDALERHRQRFKDKDFKPCTDTMPHTQGHPVTLMVALVEDGAYAEDVENRRRLRYAVLAGLKNSRLVPEDEEHIGCLALNADLQTQVTPDQNRISEIREIPYESFVANPFQPPTDINEQPQPESVTHLFWLKQDFLGKDPLRLLENLRQTLSPHDSVATLKVIGPANSAMLREMYRQEEEARGLIISELPTAPIPDHVEIYSPSATADRTLLLRGYGLNRQPNLTDLPKPLMLLRTVSDDTTMTRLLLEELQLRRVDPALGAQCDPPNQQPQCIAGSRWPSANRVALVSEWDSFYSRALIESFRMQVIDGAKLRPEETQTADQWVLHFSYLRGLDGRLPEDTVSKPEQKTEKEKKELDLSPLEKSDGNSQLDYLRRLADHISAQDQAYRRAGQSGIGAVGVLGLDTYDKLLVLQALKSRMPSKVFFSTDLDARMLQRGQSQVTRNLVLAAPYGLTLTRALQQDVPPFRDSQQSAIFVAVLVALSPQPFDAKRWKFDYSRSGLLSPSIYEVGISGFIPLASRSTQMRPPNCAPAGGNLTSKGSYIRPQDIMALRCLQDPSPPLYPQPSKGLKDRLMDAQSFFWAGPLTVVLLFLGLMLGWRRSRQMGLEIDTRIALALYAVAAICAWVATRTWRVELLWVSFGLVLLGVIASDANRRARNRKVVATGQAQGAVGLIDTHAWYVLVPSVSFVLALLLAYQARDRLTENGLGEPMFLFEGISAWPTVALRLLAVLISLAAIAWGWRSLRLNRLKIEREYRLSELMQRYQLGLWSQLRRLTKDGKLRPYNRLGVALRLWLYQIFLPLSSSMQRRAALHDRRLERFSNDDQRNHGLFVALWREHCISGSFGARLLRAILGSWIFLVLCSVFWVLWPMDGIPVRGTMAGTSLIWLLPTLAFNLLVFWVVDANRLLTRFIRQLSGDYSIWPRALRREHSDIIQQPLHPAIEEWAGLTLIASRTAAVNRLIYAPTVVMLILIASRSSVFDNWATPPGMIVMFALTGLILLFSALSLRRAAERARAAGLERVDRYLLKTPATDPDYDKSRLIRERMVALNTGAFSRYSDEPLVKALLISLTGIGGSAIVDALNYAKF